MAGVKKGYPKKGKMNNGCGPSGFAFLTHSHLLFMLFVCVVPSPALLCMLWVEPVGADEFQDFRLVYCSPILVEFVVAFWIYRNPGDLVLLVCVCVHLCS